eukprot:GHVR01030122.1.p1 GENE.GHVR01030122.1~~GHVR01030122.1.p1  ORF type:complete len:121 (-),score=9.28 GHVR01030122.1:260-622(-)
MSVSTEVYGFVFWILSFILYGLYLIWAFVPDDVLHGIGISYYPSKYWALAIPTYFCFLLLMTVVVYNGLNFLNTKPLHSLDILTLSRAPMIPDPPGSIPGLSFVPIDEINRLMFIADPDH